MNKWIYIFAVSICLSACSNQPTVDSFASYLKWLNEAENGLVQTKYINGYKMTVKYLPAFYLAYNELKKHKLKDEALTEIIKEYDQSMTFLFTIGPDERKNTKGDIMYQGVADYSEYKARLYDLNFNLDQRVYININGEQIKPVITNMESIYGMKQSRDINVIFAPKKLNDQAFYNSENIDFVFDDDLFQTGINHFQFKRENINNAAVIKQFTQYIQS